MKQNNQKLNSSSMVVVNKNKSGLKLLDTSGQSKETDKKVKIGGGTGQKQ